MPKYNPTLIPRRVRVDFITPDGLAVGKTKSFTEDDNDDRYHPTIDLASGECRCDCKDFHYRRARMHADITRRETLCKHLKRHLANLERRGQIQKAKPVLTAPAAPAAPATPLEEWNAMMAAKRAQTIAAAGADWDLL